jgi:predicted Holliday junction resolvase-like endonuclease
MTAQDILLIIVAMLLADNYFMRRSIRKLKREIETDQRNVETLWDAVQPESFIDASDPSRMIPIPSYLSMPK